MASFGKHFAVDEKLGLSQVKSVHKGENYRITVLSERLLRLEYSMSGVFVDNLTDLVQNRAFPAVNYTFEEDDKYMVITTRYFSLQYMKEKPFKGPSFAPDTNLKVKLLNTDKIWYYGHPEARNFLASTFSLDDYKGGYKKLDKGLYSTDGFATLDDSDALVTNELGILNRSNDDHIDIYLFMYKRDFGLCLKDYFMLTGYPTLLPRYAFGIWWNRDIIYSMDNIKSLISSFNSNEIPISVLLLNEFWHTKNKDNILEGKTGFSFNKDLFYSPTELTTYLHERGIKLGLELDPTEGIKPTEEAYKDFAEEFNYKNNEVIPFLAFDKMFIILYFEKLINPLTKVDVDFFFIDYKKDIKSLRALNYYHIKDFMQSEYKRPMLLTRNTGIAAHRNGVLYSGQTIVSWDTLKYLPFFNSSASNIGISWWSHDIGGYKDGIEDEQLYMRYVQLGTFSPIFRFSAKRGIYYKREPWLWDFKTYNIVKDYTLLRHKLIPYLYTENYYYADKGMPLVRPIYYDYPEMYDEPEYKNEYYFGSQLFVCPITRPTDPIMNRAVQRTFLPKGIWYDFKTGKKFVGDKRYITFHKDEDYPVFASSGAIIPLANIHANYNFTGNPEVFDIHVFPGKSNSYSLYEDDGMTRLYENGFYVISEISYNYMQNNFTLIIRPKEGKTGIIPEKRDYNIIFRNTKKTENVEIYLNGEKVNSDRFTTSVKDENFIVSIEKVPTTKQLSINCKGKDIEIDAQKVINDDINSIISDLKIQTKLKEMLYKIVFSDMEIKKKRIAIRKLKRKGLEPKFIRMFMKLYDYLIEI